MPMLSEYLIYSSIHNMQIHKPTISNQTGNKSVGCCGAWLPRILSGPFPCNPSLAHFLPPCMKPSFRDDGQGETKTNKIVTENQLIPSKCEMGNNIEQPIWGNGDKVRVLRLW